MENAFKGYFKDKRVLVTGHTGFKGSWLCMWLHELGASVTGYSIGFPSEPSLFKVCNLEKRVNHNIGDVRDYDHLHQVFQDTKPDVVFHLASQPLVRLSYEEPKLTMETNVMGTLHILEATRQCPSIKSLVIVTSDKCYENREQVWGYKENDPLGGDDPYSGSKGAAEIVFRSYYRSFLRHSKDLGAVTVRAGNVVGGGDWARDRIVPDVFRALSQKEVVNVRSPMAVRPWQYVLEPLSGYMWLAARVNEDPLTFSGPWNFGPLETSARCVRDLVAKVLEEWGSGEWKDISGSEDRRLHEAGWLRLSCDKAHMMLPWSAVLSFDENLRMTVRWYKNHYDSPSQNLYRFSVHQIEEYTRLAAERGQLWAT